MAQMVGQRRTVWKLEALRAAWRDDFIDIPESAIPGATSQNTADPVCRAVFYSLLVGQERNGAVVSVHAGWWYIQCLPRVEAGTGVLGPNRRFLCFVRQQFGGAARYHRTVSQPAPGC